MHVFMRRFSLLHSTYVSASPRSCTRYNLVCMSPGSPFLDSLHARKISYPFLRPYRYRKCRCLQASRPHAIMSTLMQLKAQNESRLAEEKRLIERKRNLLLLIEHFCMENGYLQTAEKLQQEAGIASSKFEVVENISLLRILQEFEDFEEIKFGKKIKLVRRANHEDQDKVKVLGEKKAAAYERRARRNQYVSPHMPIQSQMENSTAFKSVSNARKHEQMPGKKSSPSIESSNQECVGNNTDNLELVGQKPKHHPAFKLPEADTREEEEEDHRLLKPLPIYMHDSEFRALAEVITREIFQKNPNVRWSDVIGLEDTKRLLKEAIVMPLRYPQVFQGILSPWSGILLYGPPGNGKTMLAKAVATECKTTFFNISASSLVSKYRGDSEKLIRLLFELARHHAPSTIFLDEIDSIMSQRYSGSSGGQEHEASRRMKTELLIQMDGLSKTDDVVFVLAASNLPWELDIAMLRRLEKRVLVDLPSSEARHALLQALLNPYVPPSFDFSTAVDRTEGFSGADLRLVAKEACMSPVRRLMKKFEELESDKQSNDDPEQLTWKNLLGNVEHNDLIQALHKTKPSTTQTLRKYQNWQAKFGCV